MAAINEAWATLSDPGRRAMYDAALRGGDDLGRRVTTSSSSPTMPASEARHNPFARYQDPPRFPWRFVLILVGVAIAAILGLGALAGDPADAPIDNLLAIGSCVEVDEMRGEVAEVPCDEPHDAVVDRLIPFDSVCPFGTEPFRDRQGMGLACVVRAG
jgi:molecular chaperone DnaJ